MGSDLLVPRLPFAAIPDTLHEDERSASFQRSADVPQHGLMLGHLVVGVHNQYGVKLTHWQLRIIYRALDDFHILQSLFCQLFLELLEFRITDIFRNLNDGMAWGIFPLFFAAHGLAVAEIGVVKAVYPFVWAVGQLVTGPLSDRWGRKNLIVWGMWIQALAHPLIALGAKFNVRATGMGGAVLLGLGTAMVYPALLAAVGDVAHPTWRARSRSVYRSWRDLGYAVSAAVAGVVAGAFGLVWSIHVAGLLTFVSGLVAWLTVRETRRSSR